MYQPQRPTSIHLPARVRHTGRLGRLFAPWLLAGVMSLPAGAAETSVLVNSAASPADELAYALALDGTRVATGSPGEGDNIGAAYVFECAALPCAEPVRVAPNDLVAGNQFGAVVSLSGDTLAVTAPGQIPGAIYVFVRQGLVWVQQARLTASNGVAGDRFGKSASLNGDYLAVAADRGSAQAGTVYVFVRNGSMWSQQAQLTATDAAVGDQFGSSVSLSGNSVLIGAPLKASGVAGSFANGAAYVFVRNLTTWSQQAKLQAQVGSSAAIFGAAVSLDGDRALIGAPLDANRAGSAYVFQRSGSTWSQQTQLTSATALAGDRFGWSVAVTGNTALVGAPYAQFSCGATSVFRFDTTGWVAGSGASPRTSILGDLAGWSVAASGGRWVVGAPGHAGDTDHSGAAYWFDAVATLFKDGFDNPGNAACVDPGV